MRKLIILFVVIGLFLAGCGKEQSQGDDGNMDYEKIATAHNGLGFAWFAEAEPNEAGNIFLSPTSLFMALSMVYNGADGTTKEEIEKVLHIEGMDPRELNSANASLMNVLHKQSDQMGLHIANSIWLNESYHFQEEFAETNRDYYNAEITEIDITAPQSPKKINDWVEENTNGKIKDLVDSPLDPDLVTMLINAIYFKGDWTYEFDEALTEERPFYLEDGKTKDTPLMNLREELAYMENDDFQAVSLPYGKNQEMSMKIFLPKESLEEFNQMLSAENWQKWNTEFTKKEGTLLLPKFQLEYEATLNEALKKLGMTTAFAKGANFGKMIQESDPLWISQVKQKTYIDVNEKGTEAAAATSVEIVTESFDMDGPFYMEVNRPFFIAITEHTTDTILFIGSIQTP